MYRVCAKLSEQVSAKHVFQAPCQVRAFVQELQKQYSQAFSEPVDVQRMTEKLLYLLHQRAGCYQAACVQVEWIE